MKTDLWRVATTRKDSSSASKRSEPLTVEEVAVLLKNLRKRLEHGSCGDMTVARYADHYLEHYCKIRNKSWRRKGDSLKKIKKILGNKRLRDIGHSLYRVRRWPDVSGGGDRIRTGE